jgi:hypothetical protein
MKSTQVIVGIDEKLLARVTLELISIMNSVAADQIDLKKVMIPWKKRWEEFRFVCQFNPGILAKFGWELDQNWKDGILNRVIKRASG